MMRLIVLCMVCTAAMVAACTPARVQEDLPQGYRGTVTAVVPGKVYSHCNPTFLPELYDEQTCWRDVMEHLHQHIPRTAREPEAVATAIERELETNGFSLHLFQDACKVAESDELDNATRACIPLAAKDVWELQL